MTMEMVEEKSAANGRDDYTQDGTMDLKGRPILRSKTGRWKGCSFMIGYEVFERMAYHGVASNLMMFFTNVLKFGTVSASNIVNNWVGTAWMLPIMGAYIADAHLGRYWTFLIGSSFYLVGMGLLALVVTVPELTPLPTCTTNGRGDQCPPYPISFQDVCLYGALYMIAIGNGGTKPNISSMGADQFDDFEPKEKAHKSSFFNWWMFSVFCGSFMATTVMVYIQEKKGFNIGYGLQTLWIALGLSLFLMGSPFYRHKKPAGSALTRIAKVFIAFLRKWNVPIPNDPKELHELDFEEYARLGKFRIDNSSSLRFLDRAAVKIESRSPWMLCTVTEVEETKQMIKMIPVLLTTIIPSTVFAGVQTLFIKQAMTLDRNLGPNFVIPPSSLKCLVQIFMLVSVVPYDRLFVPAMRRCTKNPRGITMLQRMGIGMAFYVVIAASAYFAERKRMEVINATGTFGAKQIVPFSVFILLPQFALVGIADTFLEVAKMEFFYDQAPPGMKSLGTSYYSTSMGVGSFVNAIILRIISQASKRNGNQGWVTDNMNRGHLDYYYAFWILLTFLNLIFYLVVAKFYVYNVDLPKLEKDAENVEMESLPAHEDLIQTKDENDKYIGTSNQCK